jgi:hypothetical protein
MKFRAQGSTEYLVILAVVLVVALIVVSLLGQFTGFGKQSKEQQSRVYWSGATPFSILEAKISSNASVNSTLFMKNQDAENLKLEQILFKQVGDTNWTTVYSGNEQFAGGEEKMITLDSNASTFCTGADKPYEVEVKIVYTKGDMSGITQIGTKTLYGKCV